MDLAYPIIDGFTLKTKLRCNLTFGALVIEQYNDLRRSRAFRSRAWCIPNDTGSQSIPARDSYEFQVYVKPGTAIWGYTFTGGSDDAADGIQDSFQVKDCCSDVPLFSECVTKQSEQHPKQQYLSCLLVVPAPGLLAVEIATTSPTDRTIQLILWGGEPA